MRILPLLGLVLALAQPARADDGASLGMADKAAIRSMVEQQLAAFQRDDGGTAFGLASPTIQRQFQSADNFMRMVRTGYQPVYRPRDVQLEEITTVGDDVIQPVELIGPDGALSLARYVMQRQPDGSWRINGCFLAASEQRAT